MNELEKIINGFDDAKKKKIFSDLSNAKTVEELIDVGNSYNLNISKEIATKMHEGIKDLSKLTKEELSFVGGTQMKTEKVISFLLNGYDANPNGCMEFD